MKNKLSLIIVSLISGLLINGCGQSPPKTETGLSDKEKRFITSATNYIQRLSQGNKELAEEMEKNAIRQTTLQQTKKVLIRIKENENNQFNISGVSAPPTRFSHFSDNFNEIHRLHNEAFDRYIKITEIEDTHGVILAKQKWETGINLMETTMKDMTETSENIQKR